MHFMTAICGIRIIFGRYLALYRWNLLHQKRSSSVESYITQEDCQKNIMGTFNLIRPLFKTNQQTTVEIHNQSILQQKTEKAALQPLKNEIISIILSQNSFYSTNTKIYLNDKYLTVIKSSEHRFSIKIKPNGELRLKHYSVVFPKEVLNLFKTKFSFILRKFTAILSNLISKSQNPIKSAQNALHQFYLFGFHIYIKNLFIEFQSKYNFKCIDIDNYNTDICFPDAFSFSNKFRLSLTDNDIYIFSKTVLINRFFSYSFSCSLSSFNQQLVESVISEMQLKVAQAKLDHIWQPIKKSIDNINISQFKAYLDLDYISIDFKLYDIFVCSLSVDKMTGKTTLSFFNKSTDPIFTSLACFIDQFYRIDYTIRIIFLHSYFSILCHFYNLSIQTNLFNPDFDEHTPFSQLAFCTSSSFIATKIIQYENRPFFILENFNQTSEMRNFVLNSSVDSLSTINFTSTINPSQKVVDKIRIISILAQFSQELRNRGISTSIDGNKVIFIIEPFDSVVFKMNSSLFWSLKFIRPSFMLQKSMSFSGNNVNARFVDWLVDLLVNISTLLHLYRQILNELSISNMKDDLNFIDISNFMITFDSNYHSKNESEEEKNEKCKSILYITLDSILSIQKMPDSGINNINQMYYQIHRFITPCIQFNFSQFIPLKHQLMSWLKNGQILLLFGSFLKCSLKPLLYFYKLFSKPLSSEKVKHNWSVTSLRDDGSFFLIYQKKMSINFMLRPSQVFQLIIPSVGKSQMLQVPLEELPKPCHLSKLSHPAMKLHVDQLQDFKKIIENFFNFHDRLIGIGFEDFELVNSEVISLFPRQVSYARISCIIRPTYVEFRVEGESEIAQNLSIILNFQYKDNETQISIVRIVISLLDFDQKFVTFIMRFMAEMASRTENFQIDWKKTMEKTNITLSDMKVSFKFTTARDHFCVELSKNSKESTPQIICLDDLGKKSRLKSMKELVNWIQKHENNNYS